MKLEIKHLAPYLPYGLKVQYEGIVNTKELSMYNRERKIAEYNNLLNEFDKERPTKIKGLKIGYIKITEIYLNHVKFRIGNKGLQTHYNTSGFKPILRPLSDLTTEIEHNGEKFVPFDKLDQHHNFSVMHFSDIITDPTRYPYTIVEKLFEWHFDVFGLIENNLAIDIKTI